MNKGESERMRGWVREFERVSEGYSARVNKGESERERVRKRVRAWARKRMREWVRERVRVGEGESKGEIE